MNTSDSMLVIGLYGVLDIDEEDDEDDEVFISALFVGNGQAIRSNPIINLFGGMPPMLVPVSMLENTC